MVLCCEGLHNLVRIINLKEILSDIKFEILLGPKGSDIKFRFYEDKIEFEIKFLPPSLTIFTNLSRVHSSFIQDMDKDPEDRLLLVMYIRYIFVL